jgi:hypothetical protein
MITAKVEDYMGKTKNGAQNKAEAQSMVFRLIRIDDRNFFDYPEDTRTDRVCVELDNGEVTKVVFQ